MDNMEAYTKNDRCNRPLEADLADLTDGSAALIYGAPELKAKHV